MLVLNSPYLGNSEFSPLQIESALQTAYDVQVSIVAHSIQRTCPVIMYSRVRERLTRAVQNTYLNDFKIIQLYIKLIKCKILTLGLLVD